MNKNVAIIGLVLVTLILVGFMFIDKDEAELLDYNNPMKLVSKDKIIKLKADMSYGEIIKSLGPTKDVGSGRFVAVYAVKEGGTFVLSFGNFNDINELDGNLMYEKFHE